METNDTKIRKSSGFSYYSIIISAKYSKIYVLDDETLLNEILIILIFIP